MEGGAQVLEAQPEDEDIDRPFTSGDIVSLIQSLKPGKAGGCDRIRPEMLKTAVLKPTPENLAPEDRSLTKAIKVLFNKSLDQMRMPADWQQGLITSIFKKGDTNDCGNYRGITLLSVVGKLLTKAVSDRLLKTAENKGWLADEQGAFRPKRSTRDQAVVLYRALLARRMANQNTFVFFLDMKKAYDTVWREGLLFLLYNKYKVRGKVYGLIKSLYTQTRSAALHEGSQSRYFSIQQGVRQGDPLSCILFNLFINDLADAINQANGQSGVLVRKQILRSLLYADDVAIPCDSMEKLVKVLSVVEAHSKKWRWSPNVSKSKILIVYGRNTKTKYDQRDGPLPKLLDQPVEIVKDFEYLGLIYTEDLSWGKHLDRTRLRGNKAAQKWYSVLSMKALSRAARVQLYKAVVRPCLEYGNTVWTPDRNQEKSLEVVQTTCLRWIIPCSKNVNSWALRAELGCEQLSARRDQALLSHWYSLRSRADVDSLAVQASKWHIKAKQSKGKPPKGTNRLLGTRTAADLGLKLSQWRPSPEDGEDKKAAFLQEVRKKCHAKEKKEFEKEVSLAAHQYLRKAKESLDEWRMEEWLKPAAYGGKVKFMMRAGALGLGFHVVKGIRKEVSHCQICQEGVLRHLLVKRQGLTGASEEILKAVRSGAD